MKKIYCQIEKCLSCRSCEIACAVAHSQSNNLDNAVNETPLPIHRIKVESIDNSGTLYPVRSIAVQCRHCEEPQCVQACITGGVSKDKETGKVHFEKEKCVACWSCVMICPFGVIVRDKNTDKAVKCDHCPDFDEPSCVNACPTKALVFIEDNVKIKNPED